MMLAVVKVLLSLVRPITNKHGAAWAHRISHGAVWLAALGLPASARVALRDELAQDCEQRIWQDLKRGAPHSEIAATATFHAFNLLWNAPGLRTDYREMAASQPDGRESLLVTEIFLSSAFVKWFVRFSILMSLGGVGLSVGGYVWTGNMTRWGIFNLAISVALLSALFPLTYLNRARMRRRN